MSKIRKENPRNKINFQQRQIWFETMSQQPTTKSKEDSILSGTIATHKDNISKLDIIKQLDEYLKKIRSYVINENDVSQVINTCKKHLEASYDVVNINLPKVNRETNEIIHALNRINPDDYNPNKQNVVEEIISTFFFNWNAAQPYFESLNSKNKSVQSAKHILLSYLIECCYDLLLSKQHNASDSPGFESIHGQCGGIFFLMF